MRTIRSLLWLSAALLPIVLSGVLAACPAFPSPLLGVATCNGTNTFDVCSVTCTPGAVLFGAAVQTCRAAGTWSGGGAGGNNCTMITCPTLPAPINPGVSVSCGAPQDGAMQSQYGSVCTYSCAGGALVQGNARQNCSATYNGTAWNPVWTGASGGTTTCLDSRAVLYKDSVCETQLLPTADSCNVCRTLLYETFDVDAIAASRWYVDDFPSIGFPSVWTTTTNAGNTVIMQTKAGLTCSGAAPCTTTTLVHPLGFQWSNYRARLNYAMLSTAGSVGLAFNYQNRMNYYEVTVEVGFSGRHTLRKKVDGVYTNLLSTWPFTVPQNTLTNIEVEARFGRILVWFDGVPWGAPVYDSTFTSGTVAITLGSSATPMAVFNSVTVQQLSAWTPQPYKLRMFVSALNQHALYVNGALVPWTAGNTYFAGSGTSGEYFVPYASNTLIAIRAIGTSGNPGIMLRVPNMGLETNAALGWMCAPGYDDSWVQPGYNLTGVGSLFAPAFVFLRTQYNQGTYYSDRDRYPTSIWTANGNLDPLVTCVLPVLTSLSSEPTLYSTSLPQLSLTPGAPYPFDFNSWQSIDVPNYVGPPGYWTPNLQSGVLTNPGTGGLALPAGWKLDAYNNGNTRLVASDLSQQGANFLYRFGWNLRSYAFSTRMALCNNRLLGVLFSFVDTDNYYEYVISFLEGYHAVRKHVNGVSINLFISSWTGPGLSNYNGVAVSVDAGRATVTVNDVLIWTDALDPALVHRGTFGFQAMDSSCAYFHSTTINLWKPIAGREPAFNTGSWSFEGRVNVAPLGAVNETSGAGLTFYSFPNWRRAWQQPLLPATDQTSDWMARVSVAEDSVPSSTGWIGMAFYFKSAHDYFEVVMPHTLDGVQLNRRGDNGTLIASLCSASVIASVPASKWRQLQVQSVNGLLNVFVDGAFVCSAADPVAATNTLRTQGGIALLSDQSMPGAISMFRGVQFQWIPLVSQDVGVCGTATCTCANGGTCTKSLFSQWGSFSCACPPAWTGAQCNTAVLTPSTSSVVGDGLTGGAIGSILSLSITARNGSALAPVDANTAAHIVVTVLFTNVFGFQVGLVKPPVTWAGPSSSSLFQANYSVAFSGNVTVTVEFDGVPISTGRWSYLVPTGAPSAANWKVSGNGVVAPTLNATNYIQLISQDAQNNEVQGSAAIAATLSATVLSFTWLGIGGRYQASYTSLVTGDGFVSISQSSVALPGSSGNPFAVRVSRGAVRVVRSVSRDVPVYFGWKASSAAAAAGLTVNAYYLHISEDPSFAQLSSSKFYAAQTELLPLSLPPGIDFFVKVQVETLDPFTGQPRLQDMSDTDCLP